MLRNILYLLPRLAAALTAAPISAQTIYHPIQRLQQRGPLEAQDRFGVTVHIDGRRAFVTNDLDDQFSPNVGSISVYEFDGDRWILQQKLPPAIVPRARMWAEMDSWGRFLVAGMDTANFNDGLLLVYEDAGSGYALVDVIDSGDTNGPGNFSNSVAFVESSGRLIVSEPTDSTSVSQGGSIHELVFNGSTWDLADEWFPPMAQADSAGGTLRFDQERFVFRHANGVSVYRRDGPSQYVELADLNWLGLNPDFALMGDLVITPSTRFDAAPFNRRGRVGVHRVGDNGSYSYVGTLNSTGPTVGPAAGDAYGYSLEVQDDRLYVGCPYAYEASTGYYPGRVFVYEWRDNWFELIAELEPDLCCGTANFGHAIAVDGSRIIVGAMNADIQGINAGGAWYYEVPFGRPVCGDGSPTSTGSPAELGAHGSIRSDVEDLTLRASALPPAATGAVFFASTSARGTPYTPPGAQGAVCLGDPTVRLGFRPASSGASDLQVDWLGLGLQSVGLPMRGDTLYFQAWFRDVAASGSATSNFTPAISITFR